MTSAHKPADIDRLARLWGVSPDYARAVLEEEWAALSSAARITAFLPVLAVRRAGERCRHVRGEAHPTLH